MRNPNRRSAGIGRIVALLLLALLIASPAWAQFGAIKKALKNKAADKAVETAAPDAAAPQETGAAATGGDNSTVVLDAAAVDRLLAGLKAGEAEREKAAKENTSYGRYMQAKAAYEVAKPKCDAAQQTWPSRLAANEKLMKRNQALLDKMMAAAQKQDQKTQQIYADSMQGLVDANCLVKDPQQPNDLWDAKQAIDTRAQQAAENTSGYKGREFGTASDRAIAILQGAEVPGGASASEVAAVKAQGPELKAALGIRDAQEARVAKKAPAPAPAVVADTAPTTPVAPMPAGAAAMNTCMAQNVQAHEKELKALGDRGDAARKAGDQGRMMAIADTIMRIQMAGCGGNR